jgi:hypothetical protein
MLIFRVLSAVAAAAFGAALMMALPGFSPEVEAGTTAQAVKADASAAEAVKPQSDDRPGCAEHAWPYYGADCLRGSAQTGTVRVVRLVSTDHLPK